MRILTMLTVLFFCGNIFAQNSAGESAFGHVNMPTSAYEENVSSGKIVDRSDGDRAMAMAALPLGAAHYIPLTEFVDSLKGSDTSDKIASQEDINHARSMVVYSPKMVSQMAEIIPTQKVLSNHQLAKAEEKSNS